MINLMQGGCLANERDSRWQRGYDPVRPAVWDNRVQVGQRSYGGPIEELFGEMKMKKELDEILDGREEEYGSFTLWAHLGRRLMEVCENAPSWQRMTSSEQYAIIMICAKLARVLNGNPHHADSWRDIAGYAQLVVNQLQNMDGATDAVVTIKTRKNGEWV